MTTNVMGRPPELDRLDALVGKWRTQGHVLTDMGRRAMEIEGTDTYEWLDGRFFLVHHVDVRVGGEQVTAIEVIGDYRPEADAYAAHAYDNSGAMTELKAEVDDHGVWTFTGGRDVAQAALPAGVETTAAVRSTLSIGADGQTMQARWERSPDGQRWQDWMLVGFTRVE